MLVESFGPRLPKGVFALDRRERLNGVCSSNRLDPGFRKAKVLHLPSLDQLLHRSGYVFNGHLRVNTVLKVQINGFDSEPFERPLDDVPDMLGLT